MITPTIAEVLAKTSEERKIYTALPGAIVSFDSGTNKASVQVLIEEAFTDENGNRKTATIPVINEVPVVFPGSGGVRIKFPISVGDTCLIVFSSASLDKWLSAGKLVDPIEDHAHDVNDAICIPGLNSLRGGQDTTPQIEFTESGQIHAGGSSPLATKADINALIAAYNTHIHGTPSGASAVPSTLATLATGTLVLKGS
jgi:hypothetical protein